MKTKHLIAILLSIALYTACSTEHEITFHYPEGNEYALSQLDSNMAYIDIDPESEEKYHYTGTFKEEGLQNVRAYYNKKYSRDKYRSYDHFILWIFDYDSKMNAKKAINGFIAGMETDTYETYHESKAGNYIIQIDNLIYSLVETCSGGNYEQRELQLTEMVVGNKKARILNADCGDQKYEIVK